MLNFLNRKISTTLGIMILLFVVFIAAGAIIKEYQKIVSVRFDVLELDKK